MQIRKGLRKALAVLGIGAAIGCQIGRQALAEKPAYKGQKAEAAKTVMLKTADGWNLVGDLYTPAGKSQGSVILLHQRSGQSRDWAALCRALQAAHFTALALDQRGAGRSTQGPGGTGNDAPWPTGGDIAAAVLFLKGREPIGLAGASYGANNTLIYAAAHPAQIKSVALFSPGANYNGLDALAPARQYKGAVLIYHDKNDAIAGSGPKQINQALPGHDHALRLSNGSRHGTALLTPANIRDAVAFFQKTLQ